MANRWIEVEAFIRKETGVFKSTPITPETSIQDDLDVTGDDSITFMDRFFEHFVVDAGDFDHSKYFLDEGSDIITLIMVGLFRRKKLERQPLTAGMLEHAVRLGKWQSSAIDH
ncbi:DUF1493 family protein [Neisseriaceae bacterium TC5R-5]|nr:DUF1493 family protein [Neisseriaceae bacterium TC5R-5]